MAPTGPEPRPQSLVLANVRALVDSETLRYLDREGRLYAADYYSAWRSRTATELSVKETGVLAASDHCFVKIAKGRVRCWNDSYLPADPDAPKYALTPKITNAVEVKSGSELGPACARHERGLTCFRQGSKTTLDEIDDVVDFEMADGASCVIRKDRSLACWGTTESPIFGTRKEVAEVPLTVMPVGEVTALSMTRDNICVVRAGGAVACWGANNEGQLGDGTFLPRDRAADVIGIADALDVYVGVGFACALHRDGQVSCWGATDRGQVGTYATISVSTPSAVVWP